MNSYTKEIFVKDYFDIYNFYCNIYGKDKTIILMQVGDFHEMYSNDEEGPDLIKIADQLDVDCARKNKKEPVSKKNNRMVGFPVFVTINFIEKLCSLNYTVVLIDQTTSAPFPKREVTGIYSPSTFIEKQNINSNNLVSIVIDKIKLSSPQIVIGISSYDLTTGHGCFYETYSSMQDPMYALDDTIRYLETYEPSEIILYTTFNLDELINDMKLKDIINYLGLNQNIIFNYNNFSNNTIKLAYQKIVLEKVYDNIFEILDLHLYNFARLALVNLLEYVQNHQSNLLKKLKVPNQHNNNKILFIGNNALQQLDVFNKTEKSLFKIIDYTKTASGKRFLEFSLKNPLIDKTEIDNRLNLIEKLLKNNLTSYLENICDLEKIIRKIELGKLKPREINVLYNTFFQIDKLILYLKKNHLLESFNILNENVKDLLTYIDSTFYLDKLNFDNESYFKPNIYKDIDDLQDNINTSNNFIENLVNKLQSLINNEKIYVKQNERDGIYLLLTNKRCSLLQTKLKEMNVINIGKIELKVEDFTFTPLPANPNTKINCRKIKDLTQDISNYKEKLSKLLYSKFQDQLLYILDNFYKLIFNWNRQITFIDFINSGALCSIYNKYTKPIIIDQKVSCFKSTGLRHNIIEKINTDIVYKAHNISLGVDLNGLILYGINSAGKSSLMKSIGLNVILAQIGYYVAATTFEISPYKNIFTRIDSNDNIHKKLSSFFVEMSEITSILKRNNQNTLVIGDEVCSKTETKSGVVIVSYMLKALAESNSSFIFASHLHNIVELSCIKKLKNVKAYHLKLTCENDKLIYDRELTEGVGETFYGLMVAKQLMNNQKFNEETLEILNEYDNINIKSSSYNSEKFLIECEICKSKNKLEVHHIVFQKEFKNKELLIQKNNNSNLVTLCNLCHDKIHNNEITVNGWTETLNKRILDFKYNEIIVKNSKYSNEVLEYIKSLKNETSDPKLAKIKIKDKLNKNISTEKIKTIWIS